MSATSRLRELTTFRTDTGLDVGSAIDLLSNRYTRIEGWWCRECELALPASAIRAHETSVHEKKGEANGPADVG